MHLIKMYPILLPQSLTPSNALWVSKCMMPVQRHNYVCCMLGAGTAVTPVVSVSLKSRILDLQFLNFDTKYPHLFTTNSANLHLCKIITDV